MHSLRKVPQSFGETYCGTDKALNVEKNKCEQQLKILMFCDFIGLCKSSQPALKTDPTNKRQDGEKKNAEVTEKDHKQIINKQK